jgi:NAD(P)-dependent dehydrogenase (short-subunit alcohol dehydrogenase family)
MISGSAHRAGFAWHVLLVFAENTRQFKNSRSAAGMDVLVNNAGIGVLGLQGAFAVDDWQRLFDLNVFGVQRRNRAIASPHWLEPKTDLPTLPVPD